jgi:hypothetical protein
MKKIIIVLFLLVVIHMSLSFSTPILAASEAETNVDYGKEMIASGTWMKGSNITEPRPAKSKYFKVYQGGFCFSERGARYFFIADIIKQLDKPVWIKVECQNPLNKKEPFTEEGEIQPGSGSLSYTSGYIKGLEMKKNYWIKVTVYESEAKVVELDKITQHIRAYVDTRGPEVLIYKDLKHKD